MMQYITVCTRTAIMRYSRCEEACNAAIFNMLLIYSCNIGSRPAVYLGSMIRLILFLVFAASALSAFAQTAEEFEANYAKRIKEEMLFGVYIPADLEEAYSELDRLADPKG